MRLVGGLRFLISACLLTATLAGPAVAAATGDTDVTLAPPPPGIQVRTAAEALADDASTYAARYGVDLQEAMARLRAQEASIADTDAIAAAFQDRLAGISIEHAPVYRIVVLLTGDDPVPDRSIAAGGNTVPVIFRTGAPATRAAILDAIARHQADIRRDLIDAPGMGVDPRSGKLLLAVGADDADRDGLPEIERRIGALSGLAVRAFVPGRDADMAASGGGMLEEIDRSARRRYRCTSGFVVTDGKRTAITTAAHCPDVVDSVGTDGSRLPLSMVGAWGAGRQDVQIHVGGGAFAALFRAGNDGSLRGLTTWRPRSSIRAGDFVCHQGITSGYSCAEVLIPEYAPSGELCAGPCPATWTAVAGPSCAHGDSGGPVFLGETAFGLVKAGSYRPDGRCSFYFVMSTDYLPSGWTLLMATPVAGPEPSQIPAP